MKTQDISEQSLTLPKEFVIWFTSPKEPNPPEPAKDLSLKKKIPNSKYDENIIEIAIFHDILDFWTYYSHMIRPSALPPQSSFSFFQKGIKPMWEDPANAHGGRFMIRLKKEFSNKCWEDMILAFISDFSEENENICGIQLSVKEKEVAIAIWVKPLNGNEKENVKNWINKAIGCEGGEEISYRDHPRDNNQMREGYGKDRGRFTNFKKFDDNKKGYVQYEVKNKKDEEKTG